MYTFDYLNKNRLAPDFFDQKTLVIAKNLLGKYLVSTKNNFLQIGEIMETEAYIGTKDLASHARFGVTPRNKIMWGKPGFLYVYLVYGLHHLVNIVVEQEGFPAAVLLRSLKPIQGIDIKTNGPAKLCKAFNLTVANTGTNIITSNKIFIADLKNKPQKIITSPRIGIDYAAEPWKSKKWRFLAKKKTLQEY